MRDESGEPATKSRKDLAFGRRLFFLEPNPFFNSKGAIDKERMESILSFVGSSPLRNCDVSNDISLDIVKMIKLNALQIFSID